MRCLRCIARPLSVDIGEGEPSWMVCCERTDLHNLILFCADRLCSDTHHPNEMSKVEQHPIETDEDSAFASVSIFGHLKNPNGSEEIVHCSPMPSWTKRLSANRSYDLIPLPFRGEFEVRDPKTKRPRLIRVVGR
jgi:hypothetical protein